MSRFAYVIEATKEIKEAALEILHLENVKTVHIAWGLDNDGYFLQMWIDGGDEDDQYIEECLIGTSNGRILDKISKYNIHETMKKIAPKQYQALMLDFPMVKE